jgi:hypothetical protein
MNSARSFFLLMSGITYAVLAFADTPSPAYTQLQQNVAIKIANGTYVPDPSIDWSETCDGQTATCGSPSTKFDTFKSSTADTDATKAEPKNWEDPYDPKEFGQNPALDSVSPEYEKDYKWWYESK